ncbi:MAG TPA: hypothetical protein DIC52_19185 [Candidatus Latescibacteria bacterium]|nr:hypothetical protein [Candidatus Latescibacterota bacterium]
MYDRMFDGKAYQFGVIGAVNGALVLYDKQTQSRWSQLFGKAMEGPMAGRRLEKVPSTMTTWGQWRQLHPTTTVYVKPTAYSRRFTAAHFAQIAKGGRGPIQPEDLVLGFEGDVQARAYLVRRLAPQRLVHDTFEKAPILLYLSRDYATARIFSCVIDERTLHFTLTEDEVLQDEETESSWHPVTGEATAGPLQGRQLQSVISTFSLWFAWHGYRPDTQLYSEEAE